MTETVLATIVQATDGTISIRLGANPLPIEVGDATVHVGEPPADAPNGAAPKVRKIKKRRPVETSSVAEQQGTKPMSPQKARAILAKWTPKPGRPPADVREAKAVLGL